MVACAALLLVLLLSADEVSLSSDPADDYYEVYPDSNDPEVLQGRTPLHFALLQSLGGENSQFVGPGVLAGVRVALDRINNDSSLLPGYSLHYTAANSKVAIISSSYCSHNVCFLNGHHASHKLH